jgi:hypothetical protein
MYPKEVQIILWLTQCDWQNVWVLELKPGELSLLLALKYLNGVSKTS